MNPLIYDGWDEVNFDDLSRMAPEFKFQVEMRWPRDGRPHHGTTVVIDFDLHYPTAREKERGIRAVLQQAKRSLTAVFSRQITDEEVENLREHGVIVRERLDDGLLAALATEVASLPNRTPHPTPIG
jgi:hypothetical protein